MAKKVTVAKGIKMDASTLAKTRKKKGSSNAGKYKEVSKDNFAGASGGASAYSYPINTLSHARAALAYAHFAPDPEGIKAKVYKRYPSLKSKKGK